MSMEKIVRGIYSTAKPHPVSLPKADSNGNGWNDSGHHLEQLLDSLCVLLQVLHVKALIAKLGIGTQGECGKGDI